MGEITTAEEEYAAEQARLALEAQRRKEEEERRAAEEAARQAAIRKQEEEERRRQEEENNQPETPAEEPETPAEQESSQQPETPTEEPAQEPEKPAQTGKNPSASFSGATLVNFASQYVGVIPYVWGGSSLETGADCSGFVSAVLRHYGLMSGRITAAGFASFGKEVSVENMQVGDIVVYSRSDGTSPYDHVGFYAGNGLLLSARGTGKGIGYCSVYYRPIYTVRRI